MALRVRPWRVLHGQHPGGWLDRRRSRLGRQVADRWLVLAADEQPVARQPQARANDQRPAYQGGHAAGRATRQGADRVARAMA